MEGYTMVDLSTIYLGKPLRTPLVASASPLTQRLESFRLLEDAGASAIVMHSLFQEQLDREGTALHDYLTYSSSHYAEALSYFPDLESYNVGPEAYLELIRRAKESVEVPVIASLNGVSDGGWIRHAKLIQEAGADALELNIYFIVTDASLCGCEVEQRYLDLVSSVRGSIEIPLAVKLSPYFTNFRNFGERLERSGADALVLFNRFYQPDIDLETLDVRADLSLSSSEELRLRLRWVAILFGRIQADMAVTGGIHTHEDVLKSMMVGARVAMMTSAVLRNGVGHFGLVEAGLRRWMEEHEYESIEQMQGSMSQRSTPEPAAFERANYMRVLRDYRVTTS
jgi:dihydroorotate dehydrogenase (fumarate)